MNSKRTITPDNPSRNVILLLSCPDHAGLVSRISHFIYQCGGNILDLDEHVDPVEKIFFVRILWSPESDSMSLSELEDAFRPLAEEFDAAWKIRFTGLKTRIAIFVSSYDHCLLEILWRNSIGEFAVDIAMIISNHNDLAPLAAQYGVPYYVFPLGEDNKETIELQEVALLEDNAIDTIVLARYMQILSPQFVERYQSRIINIHHSFLPAFVGSSPYRQAYERGVKIIGATSHYVTEELDQGPIIAQDIIRVSHKDTLDDLVRKGRDLERLVLAKALRFHAEHRILVNGKKTVVFD